MCEFVEDKQGELSVTLMSSVLCLFVSCSFAEDGFTSSSCRSKLDRDRRWALVGQDL